MFQCSRRLFNIKKQKQYLRKLMLWIHKLPILSTIHLTRAKLKHFIFKNPKNVLTLSCEASSLNFVLEKSIVWNKVFEFHWTTATYFPHNFPYTFSKGLSFTQVIENRKNKVFLLSLSL